MHLSPRCHEKIRRRPFRAAPRAARRAGRGEISAHQSRRFEKGHRGKAGHAPRRERLQDLLAGHIPGALDFDTAEADLAAQLPADKTALIVAYCADENCSAFAFAAEKARELGYTNVQHYAPGILGWKKSGEKAVPGEK